jgi:hypothetical protein
LTKRKQVLLTILIVVGVAILGGGTMLLMTNAFENEDTGRMVGLILCVAMGYVSGQAMLLIWWK